MPRHWPHPPAHRPLPAWVLVGLLHAGLLLALLKMPVWADRMATVVDRPPLVVVTLWQQVRPVTGPSRPALAPATSPTPARRDAQPQPQAHEPQALTAITLPALPALPAAASPAALPTDRGDAPQADPTRASTPAPLNLALPRGASAPWRQRSPALDDPRSNTAKLTMEQKLANAMGGDGNWVEERVDLDHVRFRRGNQCVLMTRTRAGQLELANGAFRNSWTVRDC